MASEYRIHKPSVLATLPRPLDHTEGRIVAREVYGQRDGQGKRKRTELAIGVDGETASIYDVPASRLITSYPIPPQESFTCPPYSVRIRRAATADISRYTYISTRDSVGQKITLFKDVVHSDGKTTSTTTTSQALKTSPIQYLVCSSTPGSANIGDVVAVCQNGEFISLSGETLATQWTSSAKSLVQDSVASQIDKFELEYVSSATTRELQEGIFKQRPEVFNALSKTSDSEPELMVLVSRSVCRGQESRHVVVLAASSGNSVAASDIQKLSPLEIVPIPAPTGQGVPAYQVDAQAGLLFQLHQGFLSAYDLSTAVPKLRSEVGMDKVVSFSRLSRPFILASSLDSIGLYNYQHGSIHANAPLDLSELPSESQKPKSCQLISYLRSQDIVVTLIDNVLVSIQVEPPKSHGKRRKQGLLIDSIGRGTAVKLPTKKARTEDLAVEFSKQLPGTMSEKYLAKVRKELELADGYLGTGDLAQWDALLRKRFQLGVRSSNEGTDDKVKSDSDELPEWEWRSSPSSYAPVDRRWVSYAISRIFSIVVIQGEEPRAVLQLIMPDNNIISYLVVAGHLTLSNLKAAFREDYDTEALDNKTLANDLLTCLTDADPSMALLLNYLQATQLGELELLLAIRILMINLDLISGPKQAGMKLLKNEAEGAENLEMDLDDIERDIAITEFYLGDDSSSRSRGLTLAFTKLWRLPAITTVKAIRATLKTEEILSLIYTLRVELVRGAWTSLYIDPTSFDAEGNEAPPDGVITLIADLLGRCLDAVGAGGWLFNDAISSSAKAETGDFLRALKLEVTAALEGLEEAVYLNGIVSEAIQFGLAVQKGGATRQSNKLAPMQVESQASRLLPLGLKPKQLPTKTKVVSGGEVVERSLRERGHLISQKVDAYSLEKIAI
ncbi:hypothetical protein BGZ63DRAFT_493650 [Mariannaea sp. PMI_226]|nr:hypothetical protein BGZ63DRAFT_493650 [Mariannaea sp. PMI_226]